MLLPLYKSFKNINLGIILVLFFLFLIRALICSSLIYHLILYFFPAINEVISLILEKLDVVYSERQVRRILKKLGIRHAKPYSIDYRRPKDADKILKNIIDGHS
ncbi:MAG: winged helix-turn-helix domain-containing protein [Candidatus Parvarchaeota archaeon]